MSLTDKYPGLNKTGLRLAARLENLGLKETGPHLEALHVYTFSVAGLDYDIQINGRAPYGSVAVFPSFSMEETYGPMTFSMFLKRIKSVRDVSELKDLLKTEHAVRVALEEDNEDE